jgi:hypothetical protein
MPSQEGQPRLDGRLQELGVVALDPAELHQGAVGEPGLAERDSQPLPDVVELRAAVEGLAVRLDRLPQVASLPVGVAQGGLKVRQLAPGGGIHGPGPARRPRPGLLGDLPGALPVSLAFVEAGQREPRLGVVRVDPQRAAEAARRRGQLVLALEDHPHHVVYVGEALARPEQLVELGERGLLVSPLEAPASELVGPAFGGGERRGVRHGVILAQFIDAMRSAASFATSLSR